MDDVGSDRINLDGTLYNVSQIFYNGTVFNSTDVRFIPLLFTCYVLLRKRCQ